MLKSLKAIRKRWRRFVNAIRHVLALPDQVNALRRQIGDQRREAWKIHRLVDAHSQEVRLLHKMATLPPEGLWRKPPPPIVVEPARGLLNFSTLCRQQDFDQPWVPYWATRLGVPFRYHRKLWEHAFICQALWERGCLESGSRGLGFGCGSEPLPAHFASRNCHVVGTDMAADAASALGWIETEQHAVGKESLRHPGVCPDDIFDRMVTFQPCDMNQIPADFTDFDFCWSSCALEHLGSIQQGLDFIERSLGCLKPGGWAVHTTEFNLSSTVETLDHRDTVLFRCFDLMVLARHLAARGHTMVPLDFTPGTGVVDRYIDVAPFLNEPSLVLALEGFATTSFGIIVQRGQA